MISMIMNRYPMKQCDESDVTNDKNRKFQMPSKCRDGLDYKSIWPKNINVNRLCINVNIVNVDNSLWNWTISQFGLTVSTLIGSELTLIKTNSADVSTLVRIINVNLGAINVDNFDINVNVDCTVHSVSAAEPGNDAETGQSVESGVKICCETCDLQRFVD